MNLQQAVAYFKQEKGFHRLLDLFTKKYQSLGRIGGSVRLDSLTRAEREALSSLLRRDFGKQDSVTVTLEDFEQALQKTRFSGVGLKELLEGYFGQDILTREDMETRYQSQKKQFWQELYDQHSHENCRLWLRHIENKGKGTRGIHRVYDRDAMLLKRQLAAVLTALAQLPGDGKEVRYERLPFFASRITGDPHGFDLDTDQGRLLLSGLQFLRWQQNKDYPIQPSLSSEDKTELLGHFGIVRDDLLNFATCTGILGFREHETEPALLWRCAMEEGVVLNAPLREIIKMERFMPGISYYHPDKEEVVFVSENSGVYSQLLDHFTTRETPPILCTHGQIKLATLILLDKLVQNGAMIYYSGDFDPEGLFMAQRLLIRYGSRVKLWHYSLRDYTGAISEVELDDARLKKLQGISNLELAPVKNEMLQQRRAAYQEHLIKGLVADIETYLTSGCL
ncbi:TIGR02679 family protein [Desulforamulus putei DSM 12395]|uniref:TIGR02679 family protein n=1 Tax=Desulforamulus putei DSM 12395 TaxID=1121429 RepID=A0A1M4TWQ6_9FIRM|nr:TIGR02679 family protein [Desulforamulus putei]SHE48876.1 TIGR02679 family protein [Desulforamulus putei DSM 12395]